MKHGFLLCAAAGLLLAHPMGNFSVSHYTRFAPDAEGVELLYVLDLAELPTFDLLKTWGLERTSPPNRLKARAEVQAREWLTRLNVRVNDHPVTPRFLSAELTIADGAANLPVLRIRTRARIASRGGTLVYEDANYPERAGWKEIVVAEAASVKEASHGSRDLSSGLTAYPPDPALAPPQDLRASLTWVSSPQAPAVSDIARPRTPAKTEIRQPASVAAAVNPAVKPPGTVVSDDFLSRLLREREITPWMLFAGLGAAFVLGALHALTPGHGKTLVAAYLVGSRGTLKHAAYLGAMVTVTHTISVFALGFVTLYLFRYVVPEVLVRWLGIGSGFSIVIVGLWMLVKRLGVSGHHHHHPHTHGHDHNHHHGPGGHSHLPDDLSWGGLTALAASGGLVPCESALVLLLGAIALGRAALGMALLVAFSAGLAVVLMAIGALVLYAKHLLPERLARRHLTWLPIASAAFVIVIGMVMTTVSAGLI